MQHFTQPVALGEIEIVEYEDGSWDEFYVWLDPATQQENRFLLRQLKTPQDPFMLFQYTEPEKSQSLLAPLTTAGSYVIRTQLCDFRDISMPFELHQALVKQQQDINDEIRRRNELQQFDGHKALEAKAEQREQTKEELIQLHKEKTAENKNKTKRFRAPTDEVVQLLFSAYRSRPSYSLDELVELTNQPKRALSEEFLPMYCDKISSGPERGKWRLKPAYSLSG
jgi:hypothetical protein